VGPQRLFTWRLQPHLSPLYPLWGTWGQLPLSKYARTVQASTTRARGMVWAPLLRNSSSGLLVVGPQRLSAWRLLPHLSPLCPLWGTWGLLPLSKYARTVQTGTTRARGMVWAPLLRNSSSGLLVVGPQRPFVWYPPSVTHPPLSVDPVMVPPVFPVFCVRLVLNSIQLHCAHQPWTFGCLGYGLIVRWCTTWGS
jgi:hypothetical protein